MTTRRSFLGAAAAAPAVLAAQGQAPALKGRLKQAATRGCFGRGKTLEQVAQEAAKLGLKGLDLIGPKDWPTLKKFGLIPTMAPAGGHSLPNGINDPANHAKAEAGVRQFIDEAAAAGAPNVIVLSGNRRGMSEEQGAENCATFLNKVKAQAEDKGVTICLELLNSKVDHPDYQCDHTAWGVDVMKRVNSPRVKLLYDIYHMQIMEGDLIRTIKANIQYIGHFHTAGNPGRNEIDLSNQEINYRPIALAIVEAGYTGYLAHEYSPKKDPLESMAEAMRICDV
ncbi:MAG TPA: TIM barrel protein [Bryobacteraceae bacterium]|nr:TIM barrel protein [Bryobacteraceae bacterium]